MKWTVLLVIFNFPLVTEPSNAETSNKVLYSLCPCPFGYFEVSRFLVSSDSTPPNCTEKTNFRKTKGTLEGFQCHKCHQSCFGCHGSTDGDCNQCAKSYFQATSYVEQKINNSQDEGTMPSITAQGSQMSLKERDKRDVEELPEYELSARSINNEYSSVLEEFVRDVNDDHLLTIDPTKEERNDKIGESDLGSGEPPIASTELQSSIKSFENISIAPAAIPREIRSTDTVLPDTEMTVVEPSQPTPAVIGIYEEIIFSPSSTTLNIEPTTRKSSTKKRASSTPVTSSKPATTSTESATTESTTTAVPTTTTARTRRPKTKKPKASTTTTDMPSSTLPDSMEESESARLEYNFWCVTICPNGTYPDEDRTKCLPCDSKCLTCVGPSFMNCTACSSAAVQVSAVRRSSRAMKTLVTISCLSNCPLNEYDNNGTCTPCHEFCDGCSQEGLIGCLKCKNSKTEDNVCSGPDSDPLSALEIILPIVFVLLLVVFSTGICLRWNGYLTIRKFRKLPVNYLSVCRNASPTKTETIEPVGLQKQFVLGKTGNDYTANPPFSKVCTTIEEDGYELPLQAHASTSGIKTKDATSNSSTMRSIKPRRNDPLPPTPLEMRAATLKQNSYLYDHYVNQPSSSEKRKTSDKVSTTGNVTNKSARSYSLPSAYANSERLYANC